VFELKDNALPSFTKAIDAIAGLDLVGDESAIDEEGQKSFLYLMVPSQAAITKLLSFWKLWRAGTPLVGEAKPWGLVFECLHDLRRWGPKDRISEPDARLIADLAGDEPTVRIEIEIVFDRDDRRAATLRATVEKALAARGATVVRHARVTQIAYDAILVDIPAAGAQALVARDATTIAGVPDIYAIRPQSIIDLREALEPEPSSPLPQVEPDQPAIAAILDAVPVQNHPVFARHIELVDPDDLQRKSVGVRSHGTAMASLVVRGDLKAGEPPLSRRIAFRPLMSADQVGEARESFDPERLLVDEFVRAVLDLKKPGSPTAGVFIVNLSLGDRNRPFSGRASAWARAIDWLAHEHGVLFIVSAGNATADIEIDAIATDSDYIALQGADRAKATLAGVSKGLPHRRLLSPAEAVNAITVGALHDDQIGRAATVGNSHDPLPVTGLPTPVSRMGPGIANAIKPDLLMPGGRLRVTPVLARTPLALRVSKESAFGGLQVAGAGLDAAGQVTSNAWSGATSGAAALGTRAAHFIHDALLQAYPDEYGSMHLRYKALLIKALLLHRCEIEPDARKLVESVFGPTGQHRHGKRADNVFRMFGLGVPRIDEVTACLGNRATLWGTGSLGADGGLQFELPLPICLAGQAGYRKLSVTLVWFTAVTTGRRAYRSERLIVEEPSPDRLKQVLTRSTKYQPDTNRASRGTVFSRSWDGKGARTFVDGTDFLLRVVRKPDSLDDLPDTTEFAFAATLEAADMALPIYEQVRAHIAIKPAVVVPVPIRAP
jgi:Subtilase family